MFLLNQIIDSPFIHIFDIISLFVAELEEYKIGILGKGLMDVYVFSGPMPLLVLINLSLAEPRL